MSKKQVEAEIDIFQRRHVELYHDPAYIREVLSYITERLQYLRGLNKTKQYSIPCWEVEGMLHGVESRMWQMINDLGIQDLLDNPRT